MTDLVSYAFADGVATLTMDDGKANAIGPAMQAALKAKEAEEKPKRKGIRR